MASDGRRKEAFFTMVTSDGFVMGAETMLYSLRATGTARPIVVMVTDQVSKSKQRQLEATGARVLVVDPLPNPSKDVHVEGWVNAGYTKLHIWNLTEFSKIVYIDADTVILDSVDDLFEHPTPAFAPDVFPPDKLNAGVIVVQPDSSIFSDMMAQASKLSSYDGGDTGFLNAFFPDWFTWGAGHRLPFGYNAQRTLHWMTYATNPGYWKAVKPLKIIHYCSSPKPWEDAKKKGELEMVWWDFYLRSRMGDALGGALGDALGGAMGGAIGGALGGALGSSPEGGPLQEQRDRESSKQGDDTVVGGIAGAGAGAVVPQEEGKA